MPLRWLWDSLHVQGQHTERPFWFARATSHHSDALLHRADCAASQDTVLQKTPPGPSHAQLIIAGHDGHLNLQPSPLRTLSTVAPRAHTPGRGPRNGLRPSSGPHRGGHQPPGAAGQRRPHASAAQAPHPEGAALWHCRPPAAVPPLRRPRGDPGTHARREEPPWTISSTTCSGWETSCGSSAIAGWSNSSVSP